MLPRLALPILFVVAACGPRKPPPAAAEAMKTAEEAEKPKERKAGPPRIRETTTPDGYVLQEIDINEDGRFDIRNTYREREDAPRLLVRKELDVNLDNRVDLISYFDEEEGLLEREEMDSDFDGAFDWTDHYRDGQRVLSEVDTDRDGQPNVWSYYESGRITRKERDTNGDQLVDQWERFDASGTVIKRGWDNDGDGKLDERD